MGVSAARSLMRLSNDALMPPGAIWRPTAGGKLDALHDGLADNGQTVHDNLAQLAYLRNPYRCPLEFLSDLEREYGIPPTTSLSEADRRAQVAAVKYKRSRLATAARLQRALDLAGFGAGGYGLIVTPNSSPPADPAAIVTASYQLTAHAMGDGSGSVAGTAGAYAAQRAGYYLVNGDTYVLTPNYPGAGQICARAFDGSDSLSGQQSAGYYSSYTQFTNPYASPAQAYWPLIFFVGGVVTRNGDGSIASIARVTIPARRRQDLHRIILQNKPLGIWAGMCVQFA